MPEQPVDFEEFQKLLHEEGATGIALQILGSGVSDLEFIILGFSFKVEGGGLSFKGLAFLGFQVEFLRF